MEVFLYAQRSLSMLWSRLDLVWNQEDYQSVFDND